MRKRERLQLIETLIREQQLSTQSQLAAALKRRGCLVTQATISRDMRELGVQKGADRDGRARFFVPTRRERRDPAEVLARLLAESGAGIEAAQNLIVVRSEPGTAPTVGRAIDELEHDEIIGTVAGDDTVLLVLADTASAKRVAGFLNSQKEMMQ